MRPALTCGCSSAASTSSSAGPCLSYTSRSARSHSANSGSRVSRCLRLAPAAPCAPGLPHPRVGAWGEPDSSATCSRQVAARAGRSVLSVPPKLARKASLDVLPDGAPNTPPRRLRYAIANALTPAELLGIYREHRHKSNVWMPRHSAAVAMRLPDLLYPKRRGADNVIPPEELSLPGFSRGDVAVVLDLVARDLDGGKGKEALRLVEGRKAAQLLVVIAGLGVEGVQHHLAANLSRELARSGGAKLPPTPAPLFCELVQACSDLCAEEEGLWAELQARAQRHLEAPAHAAASAAPAATPPASPQAGNGSGGELAVVAPGAGAEEGAGPDAGVDADAVLSGRRWGFGDVARLAFGFAVSRRGRRMQPLFALLRAEMLALLDAADKGARQQAASAAAVSPEVSSSSSSLAALSALEPLGPRPDELASAAFAFARACAPMAGLAPRICRAFEGHLPLAPPRSLARLLWALATVGFRSEQFLAAAAQTIVSRQLVFGSARELTNVVWAFSALGWHVQPVEARLMAEQQHAQAQQQGAAAAAAAGRQQAQQLQQQRAGRKRGPRRGPGGSDADESGAAGAGANGNGNGMPSAAAAAAAEAAEAAFAKQPPRSRMQYDEIEMLQYSIVDDDDDEDGDEGGEGAGAGAGQRPRQRPLPQALDAAGPAASALAAAGGGGGPPSPAPLPLRAILAAQAVRSLAIHELVRRSPSDPFTLYKWLGWQFVNARVDRSLFYAVSGVQLGLLAQAFAAAGYSNKQLFYMVSRIAIARMAALSGSEVAMVVCALATAHVRHDALMEAATSCAEQRPGDFSPQDLADLLWAAQLLQYRDAQRRLAAAVEARLGSAGLSVPQHLLPSRARQKHVVLRQGHTLRDNLALAQQAQQAGQQSQQQQQGGAQAQQGQQRGGGGGGGERGQDGARNGGGANGNNGANGGGGPSSAVYMSYMHGAEGAQGAAAAYAAGSGERQTGARNGRDGGGNGGGNGGGVYGSSPYGYGRGDEDAARAAHGDALAHTAPPPPPARSGRRAPPRA